MNTVMAPKIKRLYVIVNPSAGKKNESAVETIEQTMKAAGIATVVSFTQKAGDAEKMARAAAGSGVDAVAVCGGDGTVREVAAGLVGAGIPIVILPAGSANVMANEFGIPKDFKQACDLPAGGDFESITIDIVQSEQGYFIARASLGFEADMVGGADRKTKSKLGVVAYFVSALYALKKLRRVEYALTIDGADFKTRGVTCIVTNAANLGFSKIALDKNIDIGDGLLDVLVVRRVSWRLLRHFLATLMMRERPHEWDLVTHRQGKEVRLSSSPSQKLQCDGEVMKGSSLHAKIVPAAIRIIVPKKTGPVQTPQLEH